MYSALVGFWFVPLSVNAIREKLPTFTGEEDGDIDDKLMQLYKLYSDNNDVKNGLKDVEQLRTNALNMGIMTSIAAFGLNEVARLALRTPIFKLKVQNIAFWAIIPSLLTKMSYNQSINLKVENLWRIHQNRVKKGKGGTMGKNGVPEDIDYNHTGDRAFHYTVDVQVTMEELCNGADFKYMVDNPFVRFHQSLADYGHDHGNLDDFDLYTWDSHERLKPRMPKKGTTVGTTFMTPIADTDEKLVWDDLQGENLYSNPPDPNHPVVDLKLDETTPWGFRKNNYNQILINNPYTKSNDMFFTQKTMSNAPIWGQKLIAPAFYNDASYKKFMHQFVIRQEFEALKMHHASEMVMGDLGQRDRQKDEIMQFLANADAQILEYELQDVYVTDHKPVTPKYSTLNKGDDEEYFNYYRSLQDYNRNRSMRGAERLSQFNSGRYEMGSMKQRILEPLAGASKDSNGTLQWTIQEKEIETRLADANLKKQYDLWKDPAVLDTEDPQEIREAAIDAGEAEGFDSAEFDKMLAREFNTFQKGEKYDAVTDLRRTYDHGLSTSTQSKIFKRLPDHVFWDIKKPQEQFGEVTKNPYNTSRKYPFESFFDMRRHEDWIQRKEQKRNITDNISTHNANY